MISRVLVCMICCAFACVRVMRRMLMCDRGCKFVPLRGCISVYARDALCFYMCKYAQHVVRCV